MIESHMSGFKEEEHEARTKLSVVYEKRGRDTEIKRQQRLKYVARKAHDLNKKVAETVEKARQEEMRKNEELREQWEEKIERAREKRLQLLQQKAGGS